MRSEWVILHGGALGDLVLTLQLSLSIEPVLTSGEICVVSRVDPRPLTGREVRIAWRSPDALRTHWLFREDDAAPPAALAELLHGRRVLNFLGDSGSRVHARLARLGVREVLSVDPTPGPADARHITAQWRERLARESPRLRFRSPSAPLLATAGQPPARRGTESQICGGTIVIHPGGGGVRKQWPIERFAELGALLVARGFPVRFALGPVEIERFPGWAELLSATAPVDRCLTMESLVRCLGDARLLVGNDSGPGHVAAALGVPTVTLFGPTQASVWRPVGPHCRPIQGDLAAPDWGITAVQVRSEAAMLLMELDSDRSDVTAQKNRTRQESNL